MKAIPTMYAGTQFRSRLEARWAAMFDLLNFKWAYEPVDLNGYIPDFILFERMLVEVKPILWKNAIGGGRLLNEKSQQEYESAIQKIRASNHNFGWCAIVGADIHDYTSTGLSALVGKVSDSFSTRRDQWRDLHLNYWPSNDEVSFDAQPVLGSNGTGKIDLIFAWREAGNRVQWQSPRGSHVAMRHVRQRDNDERPQNWLTNTRSWNAESPEAFCDRCGYPTGHEHPGHGHPDTGFLHIDEDKCREFADENTERD